MCTAPRRQSRRLCNAFGLSLRSNEKPGLHLPFSSPALEAVRTQIHQWISEKHIHPRLICNFDQVWTTRFRPARKTRMKEASLRGCQKDPLLRSNMLRKMRRALERSLGVPHTEDPNEPSRNGPCVQGGIAANSCVEDWRAPRTLTTLSWSDGFVGRAFLPCVRAPSRKIRGKGSTQILESIS